MNRVFQAVVEDVREQQRIGGRAVWQLLLSETGFGAGDTGELVAVSRAGSRLEMRVLGAEAGADGAMWHVVEKPLGIGTEVEGRVDGVSGVVSGAGE